MDRNGNSDTESDWNQPDAYLNGTQRKDASSLYEGQNELAVEIGRLRLEVEDLREQQRALQHDPHSEDSDPGNDVEDWTDDKGDRKQSSGARRVRRWRLKLVL